MTDLKPEDSALIERELVLAIIAASHQQPMTSPTAVSDVLSTPQVRAAIDALATRLSDPTGEVGGVEPEPYCRASAAWNTHRNELGGGSE